MTDDKLVAVYRPYDFLEADAIRQHLTELKIFCHLEGEQQASTGGGGLFGSAAWWGMRLLVKSDDVERVRKIIEEHEWPRYS